MTECPSWLGLEVTLDGVSTKRIKAWIREVWATQEPKRLVQGPQ